MNHKQNPFNFLNKYKKYIFLFVILSFCLFILNQFFKKPKKRNQKEINIDNIILNKKLECPPKWMIKQIKKDLKRYSLGISQKILDEGFYNKDLEKFKLIRFYIKKRSITISFNEKNIQSQHFHELCLAIKKLNKEVILPDVDFIISLQDGFALDPSLPICPWFVFAKTFDNDIHLLMPDLMALRGYPQLRERIEKANLAIPWKHKKELCFWRGATTGGGDLTEMNWDQMSRSKLVLFSLQHPKLIDARFHRVVQASPEVKNLLKKKGLVAKAVSQEDHLFYKYLIDVDGNTSTFERFFWLLLSNSLVLKQRSPNLQWYYSGLEPYRHYLPVKEDLSDLEEQVRWAKEHTEEAQKIAEQATEFVRENLTNEDFFVYLALLIKEYAALFPSD